MSPLHFTKGHGTENDFVMIFDERGGVLLTPDRVRALCDRRAGIGADGVIRAVRAGDSDIDGIERMPGYSPDRWVMDYWNADGSLSEMCGNGARVFGAFLEVEAGEDLSGGLDFLTRGGPRTVTSRGDGRYAIDMGPWVIQAPRQSVLVRGLEGSYSALAVDVGNPHTVMTVKNAEELAAADLSHAPEVSPLPPEGTNVELIVPLGVSADEQGPRGRVRMRVHERGSGETRSCGTGACAVALVSRELSSHEASVNVWDVEVPGGEVTIRILEDRTILEGPAVLVATGDTHL